MEIKVMGYNVLDGFHLQRNENGHRNFTFESRRLQAAQEVVRGENPDILVLPEACFSRENPFGEVIDYKKEFDYQFGFTGSYGNNRGISILSKHPIVKEVNYAVHKDGFVRAVATINGQAIQVNGVHPHPETPEIDKSNLIKSILRDAEGHTLLVGDFNAISPQDNYNKESLIAGFKRFDQNAERTVSGLMQRLAVKTVIDHGLKDTFQASGREWQYTIPTNFLSIDKNSGIRIDYIFCTPNFEVLDAYVVKNDLTEKASDHYPIVAVLGV